MEQERAEYNNRLLKLLKKYLRDNPSFNFVQALHIMSVIINSPANQHEESKITYSRVIRTLEMQKQMKEKVYGNGTEIQQLSES